MLARRPAPALPKVGLDFARYGTWLSSEVARRELGYEPPVPVDDALRRALAWFRGEKYL
jgi:nucleoside-diphosphate-sugar epimerase